MDDEEEKTLRAGLENWRALKLWVIAQRMLELSDEHRHLLEQYEYTGKHATELAAETIDDILTMITDVYQEHQHWEREHDRYMQMELPELFIAFQRRKYEVPVWDLVEFFP